MSGKEFVNTNILIYAFDLTAGKKRETAVELIERIWAERAGCLSLQVLQEFYVTATKKLGMPPTDAFAQIERLGKWAVHRPTFNDVLLAIQLNREKKISFWDAMILRSAMSLDCTLVWSEDLSDGQRWDGITVRNPFELRADTGK
jgi:predicted nucleic acid-binding protein